MLNVLLLDDDKLDTEILTKLLNSLPLEMSIVATDDPVKAADHLKSGTFNLMILDQKMPTMTGIEFIQEHCSATAPPFVATLMLTGYGDEQLAVDAFKAGITDYISKDNLEKVDLLSVLMTAINKAQAKKDAYYRAQSLENFASIVAHDVRSPISYVYSALEMVQHKLGTDCDPMVVEYLENSRQSCDFTLKLVTHLLEYAKTGTSSEPKTTIKLSEITEMVEDYLSELIARRKTIITVDQDIDINVRVTEFSQLLENLISNAIKYSEEGSEVTVSGNTADYMTTITVSDEGEGIAPERLKTIFDPLDRGGRSGNNGYGIGLATCTKIAATHGGSIWCRSTLGEGSKFLVRILN